MDLTPTSDAPEDGGGPRFCAQCGGRLATGATFCGACGAKVREVAATQPLPTAASAAVAAPAPPRAQRGWKAVLRVALAWVLALGVFAAVGLYPLWSTPLLEWVTPETGDVEPSAWLLGGPAEPIVFAKRPVWVTPEVLAEAPDAYRDRILLLAGTPVAAGAREGVSLANFEQGGESVTVGYAGSTTAFVEGRPTSIAGVLGPDGDEVLALAVAEGLPGDAGRNDRLALLTLVTAGVFAAMALLVRVRRARARRLRATAVLTALTLLAAPVLLSGCEIVIRTEVARDGSGTVDARVMTGEESMSGLMDLPNAESFIESWIDSQGMSGVDVERTTTQLKMKRTFSSLEEFGSQSASAQGSWSRLGTVDLPDGRHVFFVASMDTSSVYPDAPEEGASTTAYDKLTEQIDASTLRYELSLPGTLLGSNANGAEAWEISMGGRRFLFAESLTGASDEADRIVGLQQIWAEIIRWLAGAAAALAVFGVTAYPWRAKGSARG